MPRKKKSSTSTSLTSSPTSSLTSPLTSSLLVVSPTSKLVRRSKSSVRKLQAQLKAKKAAAAPQQQPILITEGQVVDTDRLVSKGRRGPPFTNPQQEYQLRQIFPPNTWLIDLVCFKDKQLQQKFWYVFFVEANTRYLIAIPANGNYIAESWQETTPRINEDLFLEHFQEFESTALLQRSQYIKLLVIAKRHSGLILCKSITVGKESLTKLST